MKNIDNIIKYLSGEMTPEESEKFKKELSGNSELQSEFESVSAIWSEIRQHLQLKEKPDSAERELLIAEILAEHDVRLYGEKPETNKEKAFRKKLNQSMIDAEKPVTQKRKIPPRIYSMVSLMAAAVIAVMVMIVRPTPDIEELTLSYYQPATDQIFSDVSGASRSGVASAMALFKQGNYAAARSQAFEEMIKYPDISEIQILYALTCYESGNFSEAESHLLAIVDSKTGEAVASAKWYMSLLYLKTGDTGKAESVLEKLKSEDGNYQKKASKLLKKMK